MARSTEQEPAVVGPIAIVDVAYDGDGGAQAGCVVAARWTDAHAVEECVARVGGVAPYRPGRFFERELPAIVAVLARVEARPVVVVVDGYVTLDDAGAPGLGAHLHDRFEGAFAVVGVAKRPFRGAPMAAEVVRGGSARPLYVTARGIERADAARLVGAMHGRHRIPTLLTRADQLARGLVAPLAQTRDGGEPLAVGAARRRPASRRGEGRGAVGRRQGEPTEVTVPRIDVNELEPDDDGTRMLYQGDLFTGTSFETWPDGKLREEIDFDDGLRHGVVREWYENGQLKRERHYRHGGAHGSHRGWFESGQLELDATYELTVLVARRRYDESGRLVEDFRLTEDDPNFETLQLRRQAMSGDD